MLWLNRYHRGFNRLWLVISCLLTFAFVSIIWLSGEYKVDVYENVRDYWRFRRLAYENLGDSDEGKIKERVQRRWREWFVNDKRKNKAESLINESSVKARIFTDVRSMTKAKSFTEKQLHVVIDKAIKYEKERQAAEQTYPKRLWKARGRFVRDLLGSFIVVFGFGHGVFCIIVWIIRGFQNLQ